MEAIKSVKFRYKCDWDIEEVFKDFREMIMLCIDVFFFFMSGLQACYYKATSMCGRYAPT